MARNDQELRVVIAMTDSDSLAELWRTAMQIAANTRAKLVAVFVHDERWERAASLPFTREISKAGNVADFTLRRAQQLLSETVAAVQQRVEQLAAEADRKIEFRVLPESDANLPESIVGPGRNVLIAPSLLADRPIYAELSRLDLRIELVAADAGDEENEGDVD